jgi:4-amino-4-deoxy-L-arabinose transferase-like glycosyltransferase
MKRAALLAVALVGVLYVPCSGGRGVLDYDEGHYSQVALRMTETGDWVTPYVDGVRFLEKPPLMYWVSAASLRAFGRSEFALRLPTALAVMALVWVVGLMAGRAAGPRAALFAGLGTAFCVGTCLFTRETLHDVWLVLFITLAMHAFLEWRRTPRASLRHALVFAAALAGAVMTKSLVGVVLPLGSVVLYHLLAREKPDWRRLHVIPGTLVFLALAVPWHWLAASRNPGFLRDFFLNEQILRFLGRHDPPVLWSLPLPLFWALLPVWLFPWALFLPAAVGLLRKDTAPARRAAALLATSWALVVVGLFSAPGRLEHYVFPALPAFALLVGMTLDGGGEERAVRWGFRGLAVLGVLALVVLAGGGLWLALGRPVAGGVSPGRHSMLPYTDFTILADMPPQIMWRLAAPAVATLAALAIGSLAALWLETRERRLAAVVSVASVMMAFCLTTQWSLVICEDLVSSKRFALAVAREARAGDHLVVVGDYESANSLSFYQPLRVEVYGGLAYALIPGLKYADAPQVVLTRARLEALWQGSGRVFALVPQARRAEFGLDGPELLRVLDRVLIRNR